MAGYSKIYVVGGQGGFMGTDGVNPIELLVLVGDSDRQWLEPVYCDPTIRPIGKLRTIVPTAPDTSEALLDACIAFCPSRFRACPSLSSVEDALRDEEQLDFDARPNAIPADWQRLREEARAIFVGMNIWSATLTPMDLH